MSQDFDIDIDMADRDAFLKHVMHVPAMQHRNGEPVRHNTGVYFQNIPHWPVENISTIDYKTAEQMGYFKVDFINNSIYSNISSERELKSLIHQEPMWELLQHEEVVSQLSHIHNHYELVKAYAPTSVEQLAMVLALIRPAKRHLVGIAFDELEPSIWQQPSTGEYYFKKSHAVAFAVAIVVQLNQMVNSVQSFH